MAGSDGRLQCIRSLRATQALCAFQRLQATLDLQAIPACAVLFRQQDRCAVRLRTRRDGRGLQLHQREQAQRLGFIGQQADQHPAQSQRFLAQCRAHPVHAAGGRIALVEDQVEHFQQRVQALLEFGLARHLERHVLLRQHAHGAGSGINLALVRSDAMPQAPFADAFRIRRIDGDWWMAYQHGRRYHALRAQADASRCVIPEALPSHRAGLAFIEAG